MPSIRAYLNATDGLTWAPHAQHDLQMSLVDAACGAVSKGNIWSNEEYSLQFRRQQVACQFKPSLVYASDEKFDRSQTKRRQLIY